MLTGDRVVGGTIFFFVLFQKGSLLSAVPTVLPGGAGQPGSDRIAFFKEPVTAARLLGVVLALVGLFLLRAPPN